MANSFVYGDEWEGRAVLLDETEIIVNAALAGSGKTWLAKGTTRGLPLVRPAMVSWPTIVEDAATRSYHDTFVELVSRSIEWRSRRWSIVERRVMPMPKNWWEPAARAYPQLPSPPQFSLGWCDVVLAATTWINEIEQHWSFSDAKEKLGSLRLSTHGLALDRSYGIVEAAECAAVHVCQVCGAPGTQAGDFLTLCGSHRADKSWRFA